MSEKERPGFRIGEYFVTFPEDEFVKEDEDGRMYVLTEIFKIRNNKTTAVKLKQEEITPEIEDMINEEINKLLLEGMKFYEDKKGGE
jgi:hypothetical protein